jgi:hypothetical protein
LDLTAGFSSIQPGSAVTFLFDDRERAYAFPGETLERSRDQLVIGLRDDQPTAVLVPGTVVHFADCESQLHVARVVQTDIGPAETVVSLSTISPAGYAINQRRARRVELSDTWGQLAVITARRTSLLKVQIMDLSYTGARVAATRPAPRELPVRLFVPLPNGEEPIQLAGQVVWGVETPGQWLGGITFDEVQPARQSQMRNLFVQELARKRRAA